MVLPMTLRILASKFIHSSSFAFTIDIFITYHPFTLRGARQCHIRLLDEVHHGPLVWQGVHFMRGSWLVLLVGVGMIPKVREVGALCALHLFSRLVCNGIDFNLIIW